MYLYIYLYTWNTSLYSRNEENYTSKKILKEIKEDMN